MLKPFIVLALTAVFLSPFENVLAQSTFLSVGVSYAPVVGEYKDIMEPGYGLQFKTESRNAQKFSFGMIAGIQAYKAKDIWKYRYESLDYYYNIPVQGYARYYAEEQRKNFYIHCSAGFSLLFTKQSSDLRFMVTPELGYFITRNLSLSGGYQNLFYSPHSFSSVVISTRFNFN